MLIASDIPVTLIDTDVEMIDVAGDFGAKVYFGDGTRIDVLRQAGAEEAELILFCIDGDQITADMLHAVHDAFPRAASTFGRSTGRAVVKLEHAPVCYIVREVLESAIKMARMALESIDVDQRGNRPRRRPLSDARPRAAAQTDRDRRPPRRARTHHYAAVGCPSRLAFAEGLQQFQLELTGRRTQASSCTSAASSQSRLRD